MKVFVSLTQAEAARYSQFWQRQYGSPAPFVRHCLAFCSA
jgi:hypothetical protein